MFDLPKARFLIFDVRELRFGRAGHAHQAAQNGQIGVLLPNVDRFQRSALLLDPGGPTNSSTPGVFSWLLEDSLGG
jgi:hypothetical protein